MGETKRPQEWFEMADLRRRYFSRASWVPLRAIETTVEPDGAETTFAASGVAFIPDNREAAENLDWSDIGVGYGGGPYAFKDKPYKPCEIFQYHDGVDLGVAFVFEQHFGAGQANIWHLSQDLIMALGLLQENDSWVRPEEGYIEVVRQRRGPKGQVVAIEIKSEFFRDYLAARGMAFRLAIYRQRTMTMEDASHITWIENGIQEEAENERFSVDAYEVDQYGHPYGGGVAVFHIERTDIDPEEDVPVFGPENDTNTRGTSKTWTVGGPKFYRAQGELWREEWIEPAARSERVRGDDPAESITFTIESSGERVSSAKLDFEEIGRWLYFDPRVINALYNRRGGGLAWYTHDTGSVWCSTSWPVHFGIDRNNCVNVYAYDIAKLPIWQQRIWSGHNITPNGPVSAELLSSQMRGDPAHTTAPEKAFALAMEAADLAFQQWLGHELFQKHPEYENILTQINRFRSVDRLGLLALAKDLARVVADRINPSPLQMTAPPPKGEKWGSLKSLEKALSSITTAEIARSSLTVLVGTYDLRLGDAHLPSSKIEEAFALTGVDSEDNFIFQGTTLIRENALALRRIAELVNERPALAAADRDGK